jgi:hypothetical protein
MDDECLLTCKAVDVAVLSPGIRGFYRLQEGSNTNILWQKFFSVSKDGTKELIIRGFGISGHSPLHDCVCVPADKQRFITLSNVSA